MSFSWVELRPTIEVGLEVYRVILNHQRDAIDVKKKFRSPSIGFVPSSPVQDRFVLIPRSIGLTLGYWFHLMIRRSSRRFVNDDTRSIRQLSNNQLLHLCPSIVSGGSLGSLQQTTILLDLYSRLLRFLHPHPRCFQGWRLSTLSCHWIWLLWAVSVLSTSTPKEDHTRNVVLQIRRLPQRKMD